MGDADLVERLAALSTLAGIPRDEVEWIAAHGRVTAYPAGALAGRRGERIDSLLIVLAGAVPTHVDRGAGPRLVIEWRPGDVTGLLPYSRMPAEDRDTFVEEYTEVLAVHEEHFPEMIRRCPVFTELTVHLMLDRARRFNASDMQEEKMLSLGRLAAGLAHELNNPASAAVRGARLLVAGLADESAAVRALTRAAPTDVQLDAIEQVIDSTPTPPSRPAGSPIDRADREDALADWLVYHGSSAELAAALAEADLDPPALDRLETALSGQALDAALRWLAWGAATRALAADVERAATRISELVDHVKRFTYMDRPAEPGSADVAAGLRDTLRMLAAKVKSKEAAVTLQIEADLPSVRASGDELNQVWLHLVDNALDAIARSGHVDISARRDLARVTVRVVDDGPGIPPEAMPRIFDPFFTTKEPGQGTGLGLDIARRLVRRYRGVVSVDSRPGRTEFRVSLDGVRPPGETAAPAVALET